MLKLSFIRNFIFIHRNFIISLYFFIFSFMHTTSCIPLLLVLSIFEWHAFLIVSTFATTFDRLRLCSWSFLILLWRDWINQINFHPTTWSLSLFVLVDCSTVAPNWLQLSFLILSVRDLEHTCFEAVDLLLLLLFFHNVF